MRKLYMVLVFALAFASVSAGVIINSGTLPTANASIDLNKAEETAIKNWYGADSLNGIQVGELVCDSDTNSCIATLNKPNFLETTVNIDYNGEETTQQLQDMRNNAIKARLKAIAEGAAQWLTEIREAKVGEGEVTVTVK